ncbi:Coiled-coil-helix-coiled-coil-helix domain-containing protein 1 [Anthophora quadrimaculata]
MEYYSAISYKTFVLEYTCIVIKDISKMRLNLVYFKSKHPARAPQNENEVPLKALRPLVLRNYVTGGRKSTLEGKCLVEMSLLFGCWKENQYNNNLCIQQMQNLSTCYKNFLQSKSEEKKQKRVEFPVSTAKNLTVKQINYMLRMYPTV